MKKLFSIVLLLFFAVLTSTLLLNRPAGDPGTTRIITIQRGMSLGEVAHYLEEQGLIANAQWFRIMGKLTRADRKIQPGEYALHAGFTPTEILSQLKEGKVYYHTVTIPEGYTVRQIAEVLSKKRLINETRFLALTQDSTFISTLNLPVDNLEGYLFPDTYFVARLTPEEEIIRTFVQRFHKAFSPELRARAKEMGMTMQEVLTLASVVEKETGLSQERSIVSGVFHNRLARNIPLQSDPTVIYAIEAFDGNIRKRDLSIDSPYNTYQVRGLPPGPIANPGEAAIRAALYPTPSDYVYFVSKNDGSHQFSVTLAEHNRAVEKYQKKLRKQAS
ncbi:MAG: aminodeoxychorismate lyase [Nitrospirales bacterium]|nr:MAG: aminodeoxychorismate lyase [Nitrospirales bacterium]